MSRIVETAQPQLIRTPPRTIVVGGGIQGPPGGQGIQGPPGPPGAGGSTEAQTAIAAVTLSGHRVVTPQADGSLIYADNATLSHRDRPLWVTMAAYSPGDTAEAISHGFVTEPTWNWSPGQVYLGADGALTQTPPTSPTAAFLAAVGEATSPTGLFITRFPSITLA